MGRFSTRSSGGSVGTVDGSYQGQSTDAKKYPELVEFLSLERFDDGSARELGTVRLLVEGGRLKACFNDNACERYGFVSLDGLQGMAEALERCLAGDKVDWRQSKQAGKRK